jgi:apolipoprotein N-acyltransferase
MLGLPLGSFKEGYTNSVAGLSGAAQSLPGGFYRYNKYHLVPFGEFIPWGFRWFVDMMHIPLGDFTRGLRQAPSFEVAGQWIAPNICYEDLFGEDLAARFVGGATPPPTIMANVSNLAWFGQDMIVFQHLQIARMRSLEFQRPTLRATNTGATVVIDHTGKVTAGHGRADSFCTLGGPVGAVAPDPLFCRSGRGTAVAPFKINPSARDSLVHGRLNPRRLTC